MALMSSEKYFGQVDILITFDLRCVDWHPHKGIVVSGSKDNQQPIKLWDPKSGQV